MKRRIEFGVRIRVWTGDYKPDFLILNHVWERSKVPHSVISWVQDLLRERAATAEEMR